MAKHQLSLCCQKFGISVDVIVFVFSRDKWLRPLNHKTRVELWSSVKVVLRFLLNVGAESFIESGIGMPFTLPISFKLVSILTASWVVGST